jgi:D-aspartate ligase
MGETILQGGEVARPPMVLGNADFGGTLAATRCLGAHGVPVLLPGAARLDPARWSRHARPIPGPSDPELLVAWLRDEAPAGLVVYPTCDDLAWLLARDRDALARRHHLYSPSIDAVEALLDKRRLHELARASGLASPETWYPRDEAEAMRLAPGLPFPVLLKPRTQVLSRSHSKGYRAASAEELPLLQAYHRTRSDRITSVSGFVDERQQLFVARAATKVLQSPRGLGIGICFESLPLDPALARAIRALCATAGYHGAFEVELLAGDPPLLIDFNPRFYGQLAFEVARGLPSPWLVYLGALADRPALEAEVERALAAPVHDDAIFCNKLVSRLELGCQALAGVVSAGEALRWRRWYLDHRHRAVDPYQEAGDPGPLLAQWGSVAAGVLRHPRAFLRQRVLGRL